MRPRAVFLGVMAAGWGACACSAPAAIASSGGDELATPRPPGPAAAPDGTGTVTFAVTKLYLGDTDPDGTPDIANGWKRFGYNLDGVAPGNLAAFCQTVGGASPALVHEEGAGGIENAFGHFMLQVFRGIQSDVSTKLDEAIAAGKLTVLLSLDGLGSGASYNPISAKLAVGADLGSTPRFDGTDVWPVLMGTETPFPQSYLTADEWVSGPAGSLTLLLILAGLPIPFEIDHPIVTMNLDATHHRATGGIISGVIPTASIVATLQMYPSYPNDHCSDPGPSTVIADFERASDILRDGTQDPSKPCDGISIGLGFEAAPVQLGPMVAPPPPPDPCP